MKIDIHSSSLVIPAEQRERIGRRAGFALSRLAARIRRVEVRLADLNGPRGGIDKRCRVLLHLERGEPMLVEERGADLPTLIDRAMDRAGRAVRKRLGLTQTRYLGRGQHALGAG